MPDLTAIEQAITLAVALTRLILTANRGLPIETNTDLWNREILSTIPSKAKICITEIAGIHCCPNKDTINSGAKIATPR